MKDIITKDGSVTYYNEHFEEYYHSLTGAQEEAIEKYAKPSINFLKEKNMLFKELNVLDFCFGLGYNSLFFIDELRKINPDAKINVVGLDIDMEIVNQGKLLCRELLDKNVYGNENVTLKVIINDAEEEINKLDLFDICFFDPFSPKKCPKLWEEKIFKDIYSRIKKPGILLTYSCARKVRENMKNVGFKVIDGPCVGRNAPATIALKE